MKIQICLSDVGGTKQLQYGFHQLSLLHLTIYEPKVTTDMRTDKPSNRWQIESFLKVLGCSWNSSVHLPSLLLSKSKLKPGPSEQLQSQPLDEQESLPWKKFFCRPSAVLIFSITVHLRSITCISSSQNLFDYYRNDAALTESASK